MWARRHNLSSFTCQAQSTTAPHRWEWSGWRTLSGSFPHPCPSLCNMKWLNKMVPKAHPCIPFPQGQEVIWPTLTICLDEGWRKMHTHAGLSLQTKATLWIHNPMAHWWLRIPLKKGRSQWGRALEDLEMRACSWFNSNHTRTKWAHPHI